MSFYQLLTRLAGQILLGLAGAVWALIAALDVERGSLRVGFAICAALAIAALAGMRRSGRWASIAGAMALFAPIGLLAHDNGASPWAWLFWIFCAVATERWLRDGLDAESPKA